MDIRIKTLFILLSILSSPCISGLKESKEELLKVQSELEKSEEELKRIEKRKRDLAEKIEESLRRERMRERKVKSLEKRLRETSKKITFIKDELSLLNQRLFERKRVLSFLLKSAHLSREITGFESILIQREGQREGLLLLAESLAHIIDEIERKKREVVVKKKGLERAYRRSMGDKRVLVHHIEMEKKRRERYKEKMERAEEKEAFWQKRVRELKETQRRLERLIAELEEKRELAKRDRADLLKGELIWPVKQGEVVKGFGRYTHPKTKTEMVNKGIDIAAPKGTNVYSIADGEVVYSDWFMGYGRLIMIDHNRGVYSLYAHLDKILVNQREKVKKGSLIGKIGDSGQVETSLLHFEIRVNGQPVDPLEWLKRR
jgi:septal ring factor EnvC (AmiA/AmiB activator)